MKVVINRDWGGYGLSEKAMLRLVELGCQEAVEYMSEVKDEDHWDSFYLFREDTQRSNPLLVQVVEELKEEANGRFARLKVIEIPDDVKWYIHDYDGMESVYEQHRLWN